MAKAKLIFDLNEEKDSFLCAVKGQDMAFVLWEFVYNTRKRMEYEIAEKKLSGYEVLDKILDEIGDRLTEHGINIDDLVH